MGFEAVYFWLSPKDDGPAPVVRPKDETASTRGILVPPRSLKEYERLSKSDIFKISPKTSPTSGMSTAEGSKGTTLDLKLKGTILGNNGPSYAVIEDGKTKTQLLYSLNEQVQGARIVAIEPDHVILSVQGKNEMLMMSEEAETGAMSVTPPQRHLPTGGRVGRGSRVSRQAPIKSKPPGRIVQGAEQNGAAVQDRGSPSEGEQPGEDGAKSDFVSQKGAEDQPSQ